MSLPNDPESSHDLSVPGGRPLCGADAVTGPELHPAPAVTCPACARLVREAARREARHVRPHESED